MQRRAPDYDRLYRSYDERYKANPLSGIADALLRVSRSVSARTILEAGCGTGRWLADLRQTGAHVTGVDRSLGMLSRAAATLGTGNLAAAQANQLPFRNGSIDMICCVNALHHFDDPRAFLEDAAVLLADTGVLAVVAIDPRTIRHRYHYDYFDGTRDSDYVRYPSFGQLIDWMWQVGLQNVEMAIVANSRRQFVGHEVLEDPFLLKDADSTMALVSDQEYAAGVDRIRSALRESEVSRRPLVFRSEMAFAMLTGRRFSP